MSTSDAVGPEAPTDNDLSGKSTEALAAESLPSQEQCNDKQEFHQQQDALHKGSKKAGRPRKPRPEILSLEEYDRDEALHKIAEKQENTAAVRKRGRPRTRPAKEDLPQKEKKKRGRPKDETKSNVTCDLCGKFFKYHVLLKRHEQTHYGIKQFECEICHKRFLQKGGLTVHLRQHTGERPYKCPYCPASFRGQSSLDCHVFRHTQQGTKCPQCPSVFATPAIVKQHMREVHTTEKPHTCQICGESYKHRKSLTTHLEDHDKRICTVCGKVFNTMFALMTHRHIHEQNPKCSLCNRSFKTEEELQAHSKLRGRAYQCELCCYSFNKAEFLNNHHRRDHWKELGLERLARKIVPRPRKPKPERPKVEKSRIALPVIIIGSDPKDATLEKPATTTLSVSPSVEAKPVVDTVNSDVQAALQPTNQESTNDELKQETGDDQDNLDYDCNDFSVEDVQDFESDEGEVKFVNETTDCLPKSEVKQEDEPLGEESLEPKDFVKIELDNQEEEVVQLRVDPINEEKTEEPKKEKEEPSDSEDDVPLAVLNSTSHAKSPALELSPNKRKLSVSTDEKSIPKQSDDSADDSKLYSIGDPSDSEQSSTSRSSETEEDNIEIEKPKPKRKRRRKQQSDKGTAKRPNQKRGVTYSLCGESFESRALLREHRKSIHPEGKVNSGVLNSTSQAKSPALELSPNKRKLSVRSDEKSIPKQSDDSADDSKLYSIGDPSDSEQSSTSRSSETEEDNIEIEKPKPKRKRRRKQQSDKGTAKRPNQKRGVTCSLCGESFESRALLWEHRKSVHPEGKVNTGPLICELCGKKYATISSLTVHRSQHKEYQRFKCDECPKAFTFQCYLENHKRIEHRNERLICPLCGKLFKYGPDLKRHSLQHEEDKPFKCEECPAAFRHPSALHSHKAIHEKLVFTCNICNKIFRYANSLRVHQRIHSGVKRFRCEICNREFSQKAPLIKHMDIHSVDRQVKCVVCDKVYYKKVELTIHQAKEHPDHPLIGKTVKLHACKICGVEFTKLGHLKIHSDIHGNEYRFKCDMCEDQKFKQKAGLRHHWKHFHHIEPPKRNIGKKQQAKKVEKVVVRTVMGADLRLPTPPHMMELNNDLDFVMQRIECEVTGAN